MHTASYEYIAEIYQQLGDKEEAEKFKKLAEYIRYKNQQKKK